MGDEGRPVGSMAGDLKRWRRCWRSYDQFEVGSVSGIEPGTRGVGRRRGDARGASSINRRRRRRREAAAAVTLEEWPELH